MEHICASPKGISVQDATRLYHQGLLIRATLHNVAKAINVVDDATTVEIVENSLAEVTIGVRTLTEALRLLLEQTQKESMKMNVNGERETGANK